MRESESEDVYVCEVFFPSYHVTDAAVGAQTAKTKMQARKKKDKDTREEGTPSGTVE